MGKKGVFDDDKSYITADGNRIYNSQKKAFKKYESNLEQIKLRLPKGSRKIMKDYVENTDKYDSVSDMIRTLIENEIGISFYDIEQKNN